jgi:hypothetical protein
MIKALIPIFLFLIVIRLELAFGGIFATSFLVILGPILGPAAVELAGGFFLSGAPELSAFLLDELTPRLQQRLDEASVRPPLTTSISLAKKEVGVLIKLVS